MRNFFGAFNKKEQARKELAEIERLNNLDESYRAFVDAAGDTLNLAQDVTVSLRDRIDDYTSQIEATSQVIPDALVLVAEDGTIENVNVAAESIFLYPRCQLLGMNIDDLFIPNTTKVTVKSIKKIFSQSAFDLIRTRNLVVRGLRSDKTEFFPNVKVSNFERSDGTNRFMLLIQDITDAVDAEERFLEVFETQRATINAMPDLLMIVDRDMNIKSVMNSSILDPLVEPSDVGSNLSVVLSEENFLNFIVFCDGIREETPLDSWNFSVDTVNGEKTYYEARASLCGEDVLIVLRDETDVVVTREELSESEEHFRAFGLASSEAMMIHNEKTILDWNPRLSEITGFPHTEITQMHPQDFIHPLERNRLAETLTSISSAYTTLFRSVNGDSIEVAVNEREIDWKNNKATIKVIRDITHMHDVGEILELSRERYKTITDNTFDVVACYDEDLKLSFVNQTFLDYFGGNFEPNTSLLRVIDARDHERMSKHLSCIDQMNPVRRTLHRVSFEGETRWLDWIDRAIYNSSGEFMEFQGIGRDVTEYIRKAKDI